MSVRPPSPRLRRTSPGVVSTVLAVYNRPQLLVEAVNSVLSQTYRQLEIVIVDDGSTDATPEVAQSFAARYPDLVRYVRQDNAGHPAAMNTGLNYVTGEFIQFLDSDDLLLPEKFAVQVAGLRSHPDCGIAYCYAREYVLGGTWSGRPARRTAETFTHLFPALLAGKIWPNPAPLFRREVVDANGPYCNVAVQYDWEYESRAGARGVRLHHCPEFLSDTRGIHHLEGRRKGGVPPAKLPDLALVHERILGHAREAGMTAPALDGYSRQLFRVSRRCASAGFEAEARRCLELGLGAACTPMRRWRMRLYAAASDRFGWPGVGAWIERLDHTALVRGYRGARRWPSAFAERWIYRARVARQVISGQPVSDWPHLLSSRWAARQSRQHLIP
ncbi:MAG: glycosyltransferase family A protein [Vicinamibacterales bacterium]